MIRLYDSGFQACEHHTELLTLYHSFLPHDAVHSADMLSHGVRPSVRHTIRCQTAEVNVWLKFFRRAGAMSFSDSIALNDDAKIQIGY